MYVSMNFFLFFIEVQRTLELVTSSLHFIFFPSSSSSSVFTDIIYLRSSFFYEKIDDVKNNKYFIKLGFSHQLISSPSFFFQEYLLFFCLKYNSIALFSFLLILYECALLTLNMK